MSRSFKKNPITGNTKAESEKQDKRDANRKLRHANKIAVKKGDEPVLQRESSDVWKFSKDGKRYAGKSRKKDLRK